VDDDKRPFTESDRVALDELLDEAHFKRQLAKRAAARRETIKTWSQWAGTATALLVFGRDAIAWGLTLLKSWLNGGTP
jgi:anti-sigma factor RsiW